VKIEIKIGLCYADLWGMRLSAILIYFFCFSLKLWAECPVTTEVPLNQNILDLAFDLSAQEFDPELSKTHWEISRIFGKRSDLERFSLRKELCEPLPSTQRQKELLEQEMRLKGLRQEQDLKNSILMGLLAGSLYKSAEKTVTGNPTIFFGVDLSSEASPLAKLSELFFGKEQGKIRELDEQIQKTKEFLLHSSATQQSKDKFGQFLGFDKVKIDGKTSVTHLRFKDAIFVKFPGDSVFSGMTTKGEPIVIYCGY